MEWSQARLEVGRASQASEAEVAFAQGIHFRAVNLEAGLDEALAYGDATPSARLGIPPFLRFNPGSCCQLPEPRPSSLDSRAGAGRLSRGLTPGCVPDGPGGERMAQAQVVGQVQQRHLVSEMGPHPVLPPLLNGVGIGLQAAGQRGHRFGNCCLSICVVFNSPK